MGRPRAGADCAIGANDDTARGRPTSFAHGATRAPRPASWKPLLEPAEACCSHGLSAASGEKQPQDEASTRAARAHHSRFAPGSGEREPMAAIHSSRCWKPQNRLSCMHGLRAVPSGATRCDRVLDGAMQRDAATAAAHEAAIPRLRAPMPARQLMQPLLKNHRCWLQGMGGARRGGEIWQR